VLIDAEEPSSAPEMGSALPAHRHAVFDATGVRLGGCRFAGAREGRVEQISIDLGTPHLHHDS